MTVGLMWFAAMAGVFAWESEANASPSPHAPDPDTLLPAHGTFENDEGEARSAHALLAKGLDRGEGRYIVVLKDSIQHPAAVAEAQAVQVDAEVGLVFRHVLNGYAAILPRDEVDALRRDPRVSYVVRDQIVEPFSQTIPTGIDRTYASNNASLDIDGVDDIRVNADVAVIDTGIDAEHPDLNVVESISCVPEDLDFEAQECEEDSGFDFYGHGTHVAGTIGALDNGVGAVGVAPGARLWSIGVFAQEPGSETAYAYESWMVAAVDWVTSHSSSIEVANMSLGCRCAQPALEEAIDASVESGVVYAIAAGNSSEDVSQFSPAQNPNAITVSALADYDGLAGEVSDPTCSRVGSDDHLASFSNFGSGVEVAAPGVCIYSTLPTTGGPLGSSYGYLNGTSMATPHVAGAAAVLASESNPNSQEDVEEIRQEIVEAGNALWTDTSGDGSQEPLLAIGPPNYRAAVNTKTARDVTETAGALSAQISANGKATDYWFEYGKTSSYGTSTTHQEAGSGTKKIRLQQPISELEPATEYHFRAVVENSSGKRVGPDRTFSTAPKQPSEILGSSGSGLGAMDAPAAVAFDESERWGGALDPGTYWVADYANDRVEQFSRGGRLIETLGNSEGEFEGLDGPTAIEINPNGGEIFVSDSKNDRIVVYAPFRIGGLPAGYGFVGTIGDSEEVEEGAPDFDEPMGLAFVPLPEQGEGHSGLLVADAGHDQIQYIEGEDWTTAGVYGSTGSGEGELERPTDISLVEVEEGEAENQALYAIADSGNDRVQLVEGDEMTFSLTHVDDIGSSGSEAGELSEPTSVAVDPSTGDINVVDTGNHRVEQFLSNGSYASEFGSGPNDYEEGFDSPTGIAIDRAGSVYVADTGNDRISVWKSANLRPWISAEKNASISSTAAYITAGVNPKGIGATYHFEYSELGSEGSPYATTTTPKNITLGISYFYPVDVSLSSLKPNTVYRYRIVASNSAGETKGEEKQFQTEKAPPTAETEAATEVSAGTATFHGFIEPKYADTSYEFEYGTTTGYGSKTSNICCNGWSGSYYGSQHVSGLTPGTAYHYRIVVSNEAGTAYGKDKTFTTSAAGPPIVLTESATKVMGFQGTVGARISPEGLATSYQFEYGKTTAYGSTIPVSSKGIGSGTSDVKVEEAITGLEKSTTYHYRIAATNSAKTVAGADKTFTTTRPPNVTTEPASAIGETEATLNGKVNPEGYYANFRFQYGKTSSYGSEYVGTTSVGNGTKDVTVSGLIKGLEPGVTYHYRVWSANSSGVWPEDRAFGKDETFTTKGAPKAITDAASGIKDTEATLNGTVNPEGHATSYYFEYGKTTSYGSKIPTTAKEVGAGTSNVAIIQTPTGLAQNTTYHYRVVAENSVAKVGGEDKTLTTLGPPEAKTGAVTGLKDTELTLNAVVNPHGHATSYYFEYGKTSSYGSKIPVTAKEVGSGTSDVAASETLSGLSQNTSYYFRIVAVNSSGTTYGGLGMVTTSGAPGVITEAASQVGTAGGTLKGIVNPNGHATSYYFEYGKTTSYGSKAPVTAKEIGSITGSVAVQQTLTGLAQGTTYHYRLVAENSSGTVQGVDKTLLTLTDAYWYLNGIGVGQTKENAVSFESYNELSLVLASGVVNGACEVIMQGSLWNGSKAGEGEVDSIEIPEECATSLSGCKVEITMNADGPWPLSATEKGEVGEVHIGEKDLKLRYSKYCQNTFGMPAEINATGTTTATGLEGSMECMTFEPYPEDLTMVTSNSPPPNIDVRGEGCVEVAGGGLLTLSKKTPFAAPKVTSETATHVRAHEATLRGKVDAESASTSYYFEYGKTTSYGSKAPASPKSIGAGTSDVAVSQAVSSLETGQTYHYRVVAENSAGVTNGADKTVTPEGPFWYVDGERLGEGEYSAAAFKAEAELYFVGGYSLGPCEFSFEGVVDNEGTAGGGIYGGEVLSSPCATGLPGCTLENVIVSNFNWSMSISGSAIDLHNTRFYNKFSEYCKSLYGTSSLDWGGTLKGEWNNESRCIEYATAKELKFTSGGSVSTTGAICLAGEEGEDITFE